MRTRFLGIASLLLVAGTAFAQIRVDELTEVRKIRFEGVHALSERNLREVLKTRDRGTGYSVRAALGRLPFVPSPAAQGFNPVELQKDVVRMRDRYRRAGYFRTGVRYVVERDEARNLIDIRFVIDEGTPFLLAGVEVSALDSLSALPVRSEDQASWQRAVKSLNAGRGQPLEIDDARAGRDRLVEWWKDRGYPFASVTTRTERDSVRLEGTIHHFVAPGPAYRFGETHVDGNRILATSTVRRQVGIEPGQPYSARALTEARQSLRTLDILRLAEVTTPPPSPADSANAQPGAPAQAPGSEPRLSVQVEVTEAERRVVSGDLGYVSDGGVSAESRWRYRNFLGGGRALTFTGLAQTGWLTLVDNPDERYRLAVSLEQPSVFYRRLSTVLSPFIEHRDDVHDRSTQIGLNTTLVYRVRQLQSVSLDYHIGNRHIYEYRYADLASGDVDLLTLLRLASQGFLDSLGSTVRTSTFTLSASTGALDELANPRRGGVLRPSLQVTAPTSISSTAYWRVDATANGFLPLGRSLVLASRLSFGRLLPFGKSVPAPADDPAVKFLQLNDVTFTAGGTGDVRGWSNRLLGPKVPDIRFQTVADSLVPFVEGYVPLSGFERLAFSLELRIPLPGMGKGLGAHLFTEGGRVRTTDSRYGDRDGTTHEDTRVLVATGAGLDLKTPVGPVKLSVGYKLNPSLTDLVDATDVFSAVESGRALEDLPQHRSRRWSWHLAIGGNY